MIDPSFLFGLIFLAFILVVFVTFAIGAASAAPWVPLWKKDIRRMMHLAQIKPQEKLYDLGAGDGRMIIIAASEFQAQATGFEIAFLPYLYGYIKIVLRGLRQNARLKYRNFFKENLASADVICVFLTPQAMKKLKPKFEKELKPGTRVLSYAFSVPAWQPERIDKPDQKTTAIYLYRR